MFFSHKYRDFGKGQMLTIGFLVSLTLQITIKFCQGVPIEDSVESSLKNLSVEESTYQRKYYISIPEPLVCFPGFNDRQLELENQTLLEDIYSLKILKPSDLVLFASNANFALPIYASLRILFVLSRYADTQWIPDFTQKLVDAKIESAIAKIQIGQIKAKIETINNRLTTVLNDQQPMDVRKTELAVAADKCEEILILFGDKDIIFKKNPEASMPFIILFSGPYNVLLRVATALVPSQTVYYEAQLKKLNDTIEYYRSKTLTSRLDAILYDKSKKYPDGLTIIKNTWNYRVLSYDYDVKLTDPQGGWGPCDDVQKAETYNKTEVDELLFKFIDEYKEVITKKYEKFFSAPSQVFKLQDCHKTCDVSSAVSVEPLFQIFGAICCGFYMYSRLT